MSTHNDDDDIIGGLIAAGVLIAIGYGVYRVIKSFGSYSNGDTVNSDQILSPGTEEDTQIAYVKYGYKLYNMQDSQLGYVQYGYKLFTMSDSQVGYLKYGYKIYNQAEIQIGYVKYGYKLYDMDDDLIAVGKYSYKILSEHDFDVSNKNDLALLLGFAASMSDDDDDD